MKDARGDRTVEMACRRHLRWIRGKLLRPLARDIVHARLEQGTIHVRFGDGFCLRLDVDDIHDLPGPVTGLSLHGPCEVTLHCGDQDAALPWDWLRGLGDPVFIAEARARSEASKDYGDWRQK